MEKAGVAIAVFLQLFIYLTVVSGKGAGETVVGALRGSALLPCFTHGGKVEPSFTLWMKNGQEVISRNHSAATPDPLPPRLIILDNGSLDIQTLAIGDEGTYVCTASPKDNTTQSVQLQIVNGPEDGITSINPATRLPNGTLFVNRGSTVYFNCSSSSYPSQNMSWSFQGASSSNASLVSGSGSWLDLRIDDIEPSGQGEYSCTAQNSLSHKTANWSTELLVYYAPERHPECLWSAGPDHSHVYFNCTWLGAYPAPTLRWVEDHHAPGGPLDGPLYASVEADVLAVMLNRSLLFDGLTLTCTAQHPVLPAGQQKSCSFTLKPPFPEGEPLVTAVVGANVTLVCTEDSSLPPGVTVWTRTAEQEDVVPGSKYVVVQEGPVLRLTIVNVSKEDEGLYFCRSENPLAIQELEVYLTVKSSSTYTGAVIGIFLAALIVGSGVIVAKIVYSSRDRICLGTGFGRIQEERGDVISLVESDEDEIFQGATPRLPPVTNGNHTTLVQIHHIPSSDHEDTEKAATSQQPQEDTVETEESVDLVTF